jgi:uncharacterized protein YgiM (DUF1202 family)
MANNYTNYNAMSNKATKYETKEEKLVTEGNVVNDNPSYEAQEPKVEVEEKVEVAPVEPPKATFGVVTNCLRLNVREMPRKNSDVVAVVDKGEELPIDLDKSTDGWYCVGSGYVMKEFVTIK